MCNYRGPTYLLRRAEEVSGEWDVLISFETLEHLPDPLKVLKNIKATYILCSVPNEDLFPFDIRKYERDEFPHFKHYRPHEFEELLNSAGYVIKERMCQKDKLGDIFPGTSGRFLIYAAQTS